MNKKVVAMIVELIPIISVITSISILLSSLDSEPIRWVVRITTLLSFFGFLFFVIGHKICKDSKLVLVFGILDLLSTLAIAGFYILVIFSIAM